MAILSKPSASAHMAVIYITVGALTDVWSAIWYAYLSNYPPGSNATWYWCYGFLLTGLVLVVIGLAIGRIGRSARNAELPPEEATPAVEKVDKEAAQRAPLIAPVNPMNAAGAANGSYTTPPAPVSNQPAQR
ncbi:MAG: hypothetical protein ACJ8FY_19185 [Gemmataceae bacterium]